MGHKRKRPVKNDPPSSQISSSRFNLPSRGEPTHHPHPVISLYYPRVLTLRQFLLQHLPSSSKSRRRRILSLRGFAADNKNASDQRHDVQSLANFLDTTLIGVPKESVPAVDSSRQRDFAAFSQSQETSQSSDTGPPCPQSEIVNFVISSLFNRSGFSYQKPPHLLVRGFQRATGPSPLENGALASSIPGVVAQYPNENVRSLKQPPWPNVLGLLGSHGEEIMIRLLFDCGIFTCVDPKKRMYYQLSGIPLSMLEQLDQNTSRQDDRSAKRTALSNNTATKGNKNNRETLHKPNSIIFVRRRMLYARPALNGKGEIRFGLRHIHVLNRFPSSDSLAQTVHIMKYIFPRQFRLHNVFTSATNNHQTVQRFKDYTMREDEIAQPAGRSVGQRDSTKIPKRLRGNAVELVQKLQNRNKKCPYMELLRHYCPSEPGPGRFGPLTQPDSISSTDPKSSASQPLGTQPAVPGQPSSNSVPRLPPPDDSAADFDLPQDRPAVPAPKVSLTDYATPASSVSAFCRAVLQRLAPPQFYGVGHEGASNKNIVLKHVDRFIRLRRFESSTLHEVCKGLKVTCIPWLEPPNSKNQSPGPQCSISLSDLQKRTELLYELIYYIFDSILIPLIRTNFYVTESQVHRNRLFYFRHDVWRRLTEQPLAQLKSTMLQEVKPAKAQRMFSRRPLGSSSLRLLPKATGVRPIFNLRRRALVKSTWAGKKNSFLGPSINSTVAPVYNMLNYEKSRNPFRMGAALQSVGDIHPRLKQFKEHLQRRQVDPQLESQQPLYFVRLDIQSCFDTLPQHKLIRLVERLVSEEAYHITNHAEVRQSDEFNRAWPMPGRQAKAARKFVGRAAPAQNPIHLPDAISSCGTSKKKETIFVDNLKQKEYNTEDLLDLLDEHVRNNLIRIGKKYFRQRHGIPQGSVLSSILCNLFYAELEREVLGFLRTDEALLLRLIDDFLLITTSVDLATRFLRVMLKGHPAYGVSVNPAKSLINFTASASGIQIPRLVGTSLFPYCGNLIDTRTLEVYKDQERVLEGADSAVAPISNSLTVELARVPGRSFHRKAITSLTAQLQPMYLDTRHNSTAAVLLNLYTSFVTTAMKMYQYLKSLPSRARPSPQVVIRTIKDAILAAYNMCRAKRGERSVPGNVEVAECSPFACSVQKPQVQYLATAAFRFVLRRKQTRYAEVLRWVELVWKAARPNSDRAALRMAQVVRNGNSTFDGWRF